MNPETQPLRLEELLGPEATFDMQAAFYSAASEVLNNDLLELEEKILRTEHILREASSEAYRELVDLRTLAEQIMGCTHDHAMQDALAAMLLRDFEHDGHDHPAHTDDKKEVAKAKRPPRVRQTYSELIMQFFTKNRPARRR